jgi:DNA repair photolyase
MADDQLDLFSDEPQKRPALPVVIGHARVDDAPTRSILTKATGFMSAYDYTLNPYGGCSFGCSYCYAAFFSRDVELQRTWGQWVKAKTNAADVIKRMRTDLRGKTVYMSSVTDPYQPIERRLELVRTILPELASRGVRLVVQTRSPLVTRDIDLFESFDALRVNLTVTTDSDDVQRAFEPHCPTNRRRLDAARTLVDAGIDTRITMTPLLPVADPKAFANELRQTGVQHFVVQPLHATRGRFVAGTGAEAMRITSAMGWDETAYRHTVAELRAELPEVDEGQDGFAPV